MRLYRRWHVALERHTFFAPYQNKYLAYKIMPYFREVGEAWQNGCTVRRRRALHYFSSPLFCHFSRQCTTTHGQTKWLSGVGAKPKIWSKKCSSLAKGLQLCKMGLKFHIGGSKCIHVYTVYYACTKVYLIGLKENHSKPRQTSLASQYVQA